MNQTLRAQARVQGPKSLRLYRALWRVHFYAGLFCIPFILWLSVTGSIYLFKPQIEGLINRPYSGLLSSGQTRPAPSAEVRAALAAVPGSTFDSYQVPPDDRSAARVLVKRGDDLVRVYVDPRTLQPLKIVGDDARFEARVSRLHGELMLGDTGSRVIELAASWAIVMILTGFYLWYPRGGRGLLGMLWPRHWQGRAMWRDLHGVAGTWASAFALFFLVSGLPWTTSWGGMLTSLEKLGAPAAPPAWPVGSRTAAQQAADEMAAQMPEMARTQSASHTISLAALDRIVPVAVSASLAAPVLIVPPAAGGQTWTIHSQTQNRPLRETLDIDPKSGAIVKRTGFAQQSVTDRVVAVGVAAHEGQLFTPLNQFFALGTAVLLIVASVSALVMWRARRPAKLLGAPQSLARPTFAAGLWAAIVVLGIALPFFGISLVAVLATERLLLRRIPAARTFLGLAELRSVVPRD